MIIADFETRSRCDLTKRGVYNYAADPSTDILCCAFYNQETRDKCIWSPGQQFPETMRYAIQQGDMVAAHNAEFDMQIWEMIAVPEHGFPEIPRKQWYDTAAQMRVNNLPASLENAGRALGVKIRKNPRGKYLIKQLSIPQPGGWFNEDPGLMEELKEYCMDDVIATDAIMNACRVMTEAEHLDWLMTVAMNERGVLVDTDLARYALSYADQEGGNIAALLTMLTKGVVTAHTQTARAVKWITQHPQFNGETEKIIADPTKKSGYSLDSGTREELLADVNTPFLVKEVVRLIDQGNKSSIAKFQKMLDLADDDDQRVRGAFVYAGAGQTLRYSSRGLQLQNFRRDCFTEKEILWLKKQMSTSAKLRLEGHPLPVLDTMSKLLRGAIIPAKGNVFVVGDWNAIEARVQPWLSIGYHAPKCKPGVASAKARLQLFRDDRPLYEETAKAMGTDDRFIGKVAELACGYQGGYRALMGMSKNYGVDIPEGKAREIVAKWRRANLWAEQFWADLQRAAFQAVATPETGFKAGKVVYTYYPKARVLTAELPGDLTISYQQVRVETDRFDRPALTSLKASRLPKVGDREWPRMGLYGGLLAENATQAVSGAILRDTMHLFPETIMTVHDEIILEVPERKAENVLEDLLGYMNDTPDWADGLPLKAEPVIMTRYGKA